MVLFFGFLRAKLMTCDDNPMSTDIPRIQKFSFLGMIHDRENVSCRLAESGHVRAFSTAAADAFFILADGCRCIA